MKDRKTIVVMLIFLMAIGVWYGIHLYNKPVQSLKNQAPDHTLTPDALISAYEEDEAMANSSYLDKVIRMNGIIHKIESDNSVYLETSNPLSSIIFEMEAGQDISDLKPGDEVTLKGLCTGYLMDVVLVRSVRETP